MIDSNETSELMPLSAVLTGNCGRIHSVVGSSELVRRLAEMGLQTGTQFEMVRSGATCILRVNGSKLCVRGNELLSVMVAPLPASMRHSA